MYEVLAVRLCVAVALLLPLPQLLRGQPTPGSELLRQFEAEKVFWRQFEVAKAIVTAKDSSVLPQLEPWLTHNDRHLRANAAFIFAGLGETRGFEAIVAILSDRSEQRVVTPLMPNRPRPVASQIGEDRYYAAHLLGELKDPRAIPILVPLLQDPDIDYKIPWCLGQIGDRSAIPPLIASLSDVNPSMRVLAIEALVELDAAEALPRLRMLLNDHAQSNFGERESVAAAARAAIAELETAPAR